MSAIEHRKLFTPTEAAQNAAEDAAWVREHAQTPICKEAFRVMYRHILQTYLDAVAGEHEAMRFINGDGPFPAAPYEAERH